MRNKDQHGSLDYLFNQVHEYRKGEYFINMLKFTTKMVHLNPFNAMLVYQQKPGAKYVLYPELWKERFNRSIKPDARPLVILNFKPVGFVFDLSDTYPSDTASSASDEEIIWNINHQFDASFVLNDLVDEDQLLRNLNLNGIALNNELEAASGYAGHCKCLMQPFPNDVEFARGKVIRDCPLPLLISISKNASSKAERISTLAHELGHIYCRHISCPPSWRENKLSGGASSPAWEARPLQHDAMEIEAESVSWLVCSRLGIKTKSVEYLYEYFGNNDSVPEGVSYEQIYKAANKVMEYFEYMNYRECMLYRYDSSFRDACHKF